MSLANATPQSRWSIVHQSSTTSPTDVCPRTDFETLEYLYQGTGSMPPTSCLSSDALQGLVEWTSTQSATSESPAIIEIEPLVIGEEKPPITVETGPPAIVDNGPSGVAELKALAIAPNEPLTVVNIKPVATTEIEPPAATENNPLAIALTPRVQFQQNGPNLPDELIREIMLIATDTLPTPFSSHCRAPITSGSDNPLPFAHAGSSYWDLELLRRSRRTKLALSEVSKAWRELSADCLFNSIVISNPKQIRLLSRTLDADKARRGGIEGPGSWAFLVRQLWVENKLIMKPWEKRSGASSISTLEDLLRRCPNVVAFRNGSESRDYGQPSSHRPNKEWVQTYRKILRGTSGEDGHPEESLPLPPFGNLLELDLDVTGNPVERLVDGSQHSRHVFAFVQVLKLHSSDSVQASDVLLTGVEFPALEYLHLDSSRWVPQVTQFRMPSLRRVTLQPKTLLQSSQHQEALVEFFKRHGGRLEEMSFVSAPQLPLYLDTLCPKLVRVNTMALGGFSGLHEVILGGVTHATVTHAGLGLLNIEDRSHWISPDQLFDHVFAAFPNVKTIQDMSFGSSWIVLKTRSKRHRPFWTRLLKVLEKRGIRLLDWRGFQVRVPGV